MAAIPVLRKKGIPTIFGELDEKNITFLLDTSGSMYSYLEVVKEHLIEVLLSRSFQRSDCHFNVIEYSDQVSPWADKVVKLTPQTVAVASDWIGKLGIKTGSNMLDALILAFSDPGCESVYLVTDGLPDQPTTTILQQVAVSSQGRPIHTIHLTGTHVDPAAYDFLENLAIQTAGTFHVISVSAFGRIDRIEAVVRKDHARERLVTNIYELDPEPVKTHTVVTTIDNPPVTSTQTYERDTDDKVPNTSIHTTLDKLPAVATTTYIESTAPVLPDNDVKTCSVTTSLDHNPYLTPQLIPPSEPGTVVYTEDAITRYPNIAWETYRPPRFVEKVVIDNEKFSATAGTLMTGMRVLGRRDIDGYFHLGIIKQQLTVRRKFLVEFDRHPDGGKHQSRLQESAIFDLIAYDDAIRHTIVPGDKVLAPWEKEGVRYGPGTVLEGVEGRAAGDAADSDFIVVNFFNGKTEKVPRKLSVWIPTHLYDRIQLELQMPASARANLKRHPDYPFVVPAGYPIVMPIPEPPDYETVTRIRGLPKEQVFIPVYPDRERIYVMPQSTMRPSAVKRDDVERVIPGTNLTKAELNEKVMKQLMDHKMITNGEIRGLEQSRLLSSSLKRVSFRDNGEKDSGFGSVVGEIEAERKSPRHEDLEEKFDLPEKILDESESDEESEDEISRLAFDKAVSTDSSLLFYHTPHFKRRELDERPRWQYWSRASGTSEASKPGGLSKGVTPFRETTMKAPLEAKAQPLFPDPEFLGPINRSAMFGTIDHDVRSDRAQMQWVLKHQNGRHTVPFAPKAPAHQRIGRKDLAREIKERGYLESRKRQAMERELIVKQKDMDTDKQKAARDEQSRLLHRERLEKDLNRTQNEEKMISHAMETKKALQAQVMQRIEDYSMRDQERQRAKLEAITKRAQRRAEVQTQRQKEIEETIERRQEIKRQNTDLRWQEHSEKLAEQQQQYAQRDVQKRNAEITRREHFREIEKDNQEKKDLRIAVKEMKMQEYRSQVLP
ncbi:uncharacterized protein LOC144452613 [Glandiceps talaboti]